MIPNEKFQCSQYKWAYMSNYIYMNNQAMYIETRLILNKALIWLDLVKNEDNLDRKIMFQ